MQSNLAYKEPYLDEWKHKEIIGGKVVMMAPASTNHHRISFSISNIFYNFLKNRRCEYFPDGEALYLNEEEYYIPDGMVVCDPDKVRADGVHGAPDLVVEILSPSTGRNDRTHKKDVYERYGVREYWIVSPGDLSVEQYVLEDGRFVLRDIYYRYPDMEDGKPVNATEFQCSLFDDLTIHVEDVFGRVTV